MCVCRHTHANVRRSFWAETNNSGDLVVADTLKPTAGKAHALMLKHLHACASGARLKCSHKLDRSN